MQYKTKRHFFTDTGQIKPGVILNNLDDAIAKSWEQAGYIEKVEKETKPKKQPKNKADKTPKEVK